MNDTRRSSEDWGIIPLPLVIGVTGHRDLREEDRASLKEQVRRIFAELQKRYPNTPLVLLSPLAQGADRLVAQVALEKGIRLVAPLPMSKALYEEDFQSKASRDEFNGLLQQAEWYFELPLLQGAQEEEVQQHGLAREQQYAQVGAYIVLHSQILIALWDGRYTDKIGSTSQIVTFQLQGVPEPYAPPQSPLDEVESGQVYQIVTPRIKNPIPIGQPFQLRMLSSKSRIREETFFYKRDNATGGHRSIDGNTGKRQSDESNTRTEERDFERTFQRLDTFNQEAIRLGPRLTHQQEQSKAQLLDALDSTILSSSLKVTLDRYAKLYGVADALAIYFRDQSVKMLLLLFSLSFLAVFWFDLYSNLEDYLVKLMGDIWGRWLGFLFLVFYLILLLIAYYIWYYRVTRGDYKNKYLDYRALAEGLRVQFFWCLAGVPDSVALYYLRKQKSELDWIRKSIRIANLLCSTGSGESPADPALGVAGGRYHLLLKHWVSSQATWFAGAATRDQRRLEEKERWVSRLFVTGVVLAVGLLILQIPPLPHDAVSPQLIVIMSLALVLAALMEGYADKRAYAEQGQQYQRMSHLFWLASQSLRDSLEQGKPQAAERVIRELGEEALAENGDWVILHRTRPISVPMGG